MTDWRSESFRDNIVAKLNGHIVQPMRTDARQMEANIFQKARSEHEYMAYIARLIVYIRDKSKTEVKSPMPHATNNKSSAAGNTTASSHPNNGDEDDDDDNFDEKTAPAAPAHLFNPLTAPSKSDAVSVLDGSSAQRRAEPTASQRLDILRTAIATVLQAPGWRSAGATASVMRPQIALFGQYVAAQLARMADDDNEELLLATQQKLLAVLNNAV